MIIKNINTKNPNYVRINYMEQLEKLKKITTSIKGGPAPYFELIHVVMAILTMGENPGIGRKELAKRIGLGEGSMRTLINKLKNNDLIIITREGCRLSNTGIELYNWLLNKISSFNKIDLKEIWGRQFSVGVVVKNAEKLVKKGIEQRDAAIRFGATGAMTLIFKSGKLLMPELTNLSEEFPEFASRLLNNFSLSEGDVLIIVGADDYYNACHGAIAAALTTLGLV
ncbi:MAG: DUF4443 domain-containing protein [Nitrososphaerota archaeon]